MKTIFLLTALALNAGAQVRVAATAEAFRAPVPLSAPALGASLAAPPLAPASLSASALVAAPALSVPAAAAPVLSAPEAGGLPSAPGAAVVAAAAAEVARALDRVGDLGKTSASDAQGAGRVLETALTGAPFAANTAAELDFAAQTPSRLAARVDDLAGERGLKARTMTGARFLGLADEAHARSAETPAPTPAAAAAAREIGAAVVRVARALIPADAPLIDHLARAMSVWQVMGQEAAVAAEKGVLSAIVDDARLFASQVEESVAPAPAPPAAPRTGLLPSAHPEDAEGYAAISEPGSVFDWRPFETAPNHGFAPLDALIRRVYRERSVPAHANGWEIPGAAGRAAARAYFYGERHTDGGLIAANMSRLVEDARPGKPIIVLVEGYTGWTMRGYQGLRYLAARGLDADALAAKGVAAHLVEVRGWDTIDGYDASKRPLFQHHMNMVELNRLAHSDSRGWRYYRDFARAAWTAWRSREELQRAAIGARNSDLDAAVARALRSAEESGATVHVIAGADHLMESPRLSAVLGLPSFRKSLRAALAGTPFWASMPPSSAPR